MKKSLRFFSSRKIEELTQARLDEYAGKHGCEIALPVPIERIVEDLFDLRMVWEPIEEMIG